MIGQHRTALVTGVSRGIGVYIARALARQGMDLVLAARSGDELERVAQEIRALGVHATAVPTDLRQREDLIQLVTKAKAELGSIDVLINNAGFDNPIRFQHEKPEVIEAMIATNLTAPMILTRLVLPHMLQRRQGHIVNISTLAARIPFPYDVAYAASKAGLAHFTTSLRVECKGTGVSASVILPGQYSGAGMAERALEEAGMLKPGPVPTSQPEAAGAAVIRAIEKDIPELAVPAPAILFARVSGMGTLFFRQTQVTAMLQGLADAKTPGLE